MEGYKCLRCGAVWYSACPPELSLSPLCEGCGGGLIRREEEKEGKVLPFRARVQKG